MLEHAIKHLPVVAADGLVVGLVEQVGLLASRGSETFRLRRALERAADPTELTS